MIKKIYFEYFKNIYKSWFMLDSLVRRDILSRYRKSYLGVAWTLITPFCMVSVIGIVYSVVFKLPLIEFIPFLFSGLIPWFFISGCADGGTMSFIAAEGFITQTNAPIEIFPIRTVMGNFINLFFSSVAYFLIYGLIKPDAFSHYMIYLFPALFIAAVFGVAIANITSIINLYIRDYSHLQSIIIQGLFYITPIIYPIEIMKEKGFEEIYIYNPFYYLIEIVRQSMLGRAPSPLSVWVIASIISFGTFVFSVYLLKSIGRKIIFRF